MKDPLIGRRYLVVEDEYLIACDLIKTLEEAGAVVVGPVSDLARALGVLSHDNVELDGAVLDVDLAGEMVYPVATLLTNWGTPFVFVTGYECSFLPDDFSHAPCLTKPYEEAMLIDILQGLQRINPTAIEQTLNQTRAKAKAQP